MTDETTQDTAEMPESAGTPADATAAAAPAAGPQAAGQPAKHDHNALVAFIAGVLAGMLLLGMLFGAGALVRRVFAGNNFAQRGAMMQGYAERGYQQGNGSMMDRRGWNQGQNNGQYGNGQYGDGQEYCPGGGGRGYRNRDWNGTAPSNPGTLPVTPDTTQ